LQIDFPVRESDSGWWIAISGQCDSARNVELMREGRHGEDVRARARKILAAEQLGNFARNREEY
jgi:hypothetical protein